jgi:hypothetical protein
MPPHLREIDEVPNSAQGFSHGQCAVEMMSMFDPDVGMFDAELFWPVVAEWWEMCEFSPYEFGKLMRRLKPYWSPDYMSKKDRKVYDALPAIIVGSPKTKPSYEKCALGAHDIVAIFEAPDDETATSVILSADELGNVRSETMRGFTAVEMEKLLAKVD